MTALFAIRNPVKREWMRRCQVEMATELARAAVADPDRYAETMKDAGAAGDVKGDLVSYERMKAFVDGNAYTIEGDFGTGVYMWLILGRAD